MVNGKLRTVTVLLCSEYLVRSAEVRRTKNYEPRTTHEEPRTFKKPI
jgi:hypothetical protein